MKVVITSARLGRCVVAMTSIVTALLGNLCPAQATMNLGKLIPGIVTSHQAKGRQVIHVPMDAVNLKDLEDNVHPNVAGSLKMAQAWHATLVKPTKK